MTDLHGYIDRDTTDEYLDKTEIKYSDRLMPATGEQLDKLLDPEYRRERGLGPLPKIPSPIQR